jgi:dGTPase
VTWIRTRAQIEAEEMERLAPVAVKSGQSRGRLHPQPEHPYRSAFQRDRDRVVHSRAFRRLEYKTQVFVQHEGDHQRNRLTHTLEGAQIARTIARALRLNEELAEAIALVHDVGHTPFGHAGERVLAELLRDEGGFDHNRQTLRVVDLLEERYPDFPGLNLTFETREGILKHGAPWPHPVALPEMGAQRSLEAQVADVADEIAYVNHDLDDGLRSDLLAWETLDDVALFAQARRRAAERHGGELPERVRRSQTIIALIDGLVTDVVETTGRRLEACGIASAEELRATPGALVAFSPETERSKLELKRFLLENFYRHPRVLHATRRAEELLAELFRAYRDNPGLLPGSVRERFGAEGEARAIADYVAGMTDRLAVAEHGKLVGSDGGL